MKWIHGMRVAKMKKSMIVIVAVIVTAAIGIITLYWILFKNDAKVELANQSQANVEKPKPRPITKAIRDEQKKYLDLINEFVRLGLFHNPDLSDRIVELDVTPDFMSIKYSEKTVIVHTVWYYQYISGKELPRIELRSDITGNPVGSYTYGEGLIIK